MANPNNLTSTNVSGNTENPTDFFFNNFFQPAFTVSQNVDDAVIGYFEKITDDKESAKILASAVIYTSLARNINPMETLTKFSSMDASDLNSYVVMFLNLNRTGTSYLGINNTQKVSKYIQRTILP
jgi:hypothetical protein